MNSVNVQNLVSIWWNRHTISEGDKMKLSKYYDGWVLDKISYASSIA